MRFFRKDLEGVSLFHGFPFDSNTIEQSKCIIDINESFFSHIRDVICDKNLDLYLYIISWIPYLIQNHGANTEIALVIIGEQERGKNKFFTDVVSKLFGRYVISNENNINNIIGRFNSSIENKMLIVCNDLQSIDNAEHLNTDCIKT
ncbi:MAG: hypothetical protein Ta2E_00450 [Mycoplasmoidaceae bacterium]|nr:MAG: hypothetical protein Ta2E_00450 [Mycoplasmoidaceae bacterium]